MNPFLSPDQQAAAARFRAFADAEVAPYADVVHRDQHTPADRVDALATAGLLGLGIGAARGGGGSDLVTVGLLAEALGRACGSVRSLATVHGMVAHTVERWGSDELAAAWLPRLAAGEAIAAFALSEPEAGSDAASVRLSAQRHGADVVLDGTKTWITYGDLADVYLVFAAAGRGTEAFLVERDRPGLTVEPLRSLVGLRGSMTATLRFEGVRVPASNRVGPAAPFGAAVLATALTHGRLTVAMGCVGLIRACLDVAAAHTAARVQFGRPLSEFQLVRRLVADMAVEAEAGEGLGRRGAALLDAGHPDGPDAASQAKYFAACAAGRAANAAVQLLGARGCTDAAPAHRLLADAKVMELIEGSTQIHQDGLGAAVFRARRAAPRAAPAPLAHV